MTVYTARDLQNAFMSGSGATLSTGHQEFMESYGSYGYFSAVKVFKETLDQQYGGDIASMFAGANMGEFKTTVSHLITDIHSDDYLDRTLGYGDQKFDVKYVIELVNGEYQVAFKISVGKEDYNFIGSGEHKATEFLRSITGFLLDPFGLGKTVQVDYTGEPASYVLQAADIAGHAATYDALTAEGRSLRDSAFSSPTGLADLVGHVLVNSPQFFYEFPEAGVTLATTLGAIVIGGSVILNKVDGAFQTFVLGNQPLVYDSTGNLAYNTLSAELSGLAALDLGVLSGTGLEGLVISAAWPSDIKWDWSSLLLDDVTLVAPIADGSGGYSDLAMPGIVVSDSSGNFTGTFAQTSDGIAIWQVASLADSITQTAIAKPGGGLAVVTDNGAVTGQFNYSGAIEPRACERANSASQSCA